jgi:aldose 1-epimerase
MATLSSAQGGSAQTPPDPGSTPPAIEGTTLAVNGFTLDREPYGVLNDGRAAALFTLRNPAGMEVRLTDYAGVITAISVPDRSGTFANVVESYPALADFVRRAYVNALIGRYANRIAGASFTIDGVGYALPANDRGNTLHGGPNGFHRRLFEASPFVDERGAGVVLRTISPDGEAGFPGQVEIEATYLLTAENALVLEYRATADKATHLNLTNHAYFNLSGVGGSEIYDHALTLNASQVVAAGAGLIPTGEVIAVAGTPFDFTQPTVIRDLTAADHSQLAITNGDFDHNFVLDGASGGESPGALAEGMPPLLTAGRLTHPGSGRVMEVLTTKPGIQLYTGRRTGVALETQYYPDTPNRPEFPSSLLRPGEEYRHTTVYRFSVEP